MKNLLIILVFGLSTICIGQTKKEMTFNSKNTEKMRQFFYEFDDNFNLAMVSKDSTFFANHMTDSFINCTPAGEVNSKTEEISLLLKLPFTHVERIAQKYDIFTLSDKIATMSVIKKINRKDGSIINVRRTIVYERIKKEWKIASGQGTNVLPKYLN
ncbi:MAG: hypothetical protein V4683_12590 [Bacteroidota bacterium]